jgi:TldD protein
MSATEQTSIDAVMTRLLEPAGLGERQLSLTLGSLMRSGVDYADLYFQVSRQESWTLEDGIIREGSFSLDQGVGVRANSGEKTGFAYSDELVLPALQSAAGAARAIAKQGQEKSVQAWRRNSPAVLYPDSDPTTSIDDAQKTGLLLELDAAVRGLDSRVEQVIISMASSQDLILCAASDGTMAADVRPLIRLNISVILEQDGKRAVRHSSSLGKRYARLRCNWRRCRHLQEPCPSFWVTVGLVFCCTRRLGTDSKVISIARVCLLSAARWARKSRPKNARSSMTER